MKKVYAIKTFNSYLAEQDIGYGDEYQINPRLGVYTDKAEAEVIADEKGGYVVEMEVHDE